MVFFLKLPQGIINNFWQITLYTVFGIVMICFQSVDIMLGLLHDSKCQRENDHVSFLEQTHEYERNLFTKHLINWDANDTGMKSWSHDMAGLLSKLEFSAIFVNRQPIQLYL